jgi:hypothetical protein
MCGALVKEDDSHDVTVIEDEDLMRVRLWSEALGK